MNVIQTRCQWLETSTSNIDLVMDKGKVMLVCCPFIGPFEGGNNACSSRQKPENRRECYVLYCARIQGPDNPPDQVNPGTDDKRQKP